MPGALEAFRRLAEQFDCRVVTARAETARPLTERWFRRHLGLVPPLFMRPSPVETSAQFKVRVLRELSPVAHFEDDPFTAAWAAEIVPKVFLVDWRRNRWLSGANIVRVQSVTDALLQLGVSTQASREAS